MMKPSPVRLTRSKVRRSSCLWPRMVSILSASTSWRSWDEAVSALSLPARPSHSLVDMAAAAGGGGRAVVVADAIAIAIAVAVAGVVTERTETED